MRAQPGSVGAAFTQVSISGTAFWAASLTSTASGFESSTFVLFGTTATLSLSAAQAEFTTMLAQDLFVDPNLIA
jgi:hypothetical protein